MALIPTTFMFGLNVTFVDFAPFILPSPHQWHDFVVPLGVAMRRGHLVMVVMSFRMQFCVHHWRPTPVRRLIHCFLFGSCVLNIRGQFGVVENRRFVALAPLPPDVIDFLTQGPL